MVSSAYLRLLIFLPAILIPACVSSSPAFLKKIRDTKGAFHAKMGSIKDRNDMDLTEAEDIKKRG